LHIFALNNKQVTKKSLDRKAAQPVIIEGRDSGKTDQEIYGELIEQYYDKKGVALLITGTPTRENNEKYKTLNTLLVGILGISIIFKIMAIIAISLTAGELWLMLLVFIAPIFAGYFMYEIARYNAPIYRFCGLITIATSLRGLEHISTASDIVVTIAFVVSIAGLSFYLDSKLFPKYSPRNLVKDSSGEYVV
jgi:hypothetical protein